mmetsp:Transcript_21676/g.47329  ORF Transcript_21676/g.47329 Transcript_21676/m.47329 type:complete len:85 (-) Transcript_21676:527-781(-)
MLISGLGRRGFRTTILLVLKFVKTLHQQYLIQVVVKTAIKTGVDVNTAIPITPVFIMVKSTTITIVKYVLVSRLAPTLAMQELS